MILQAALAEAGWLVTQNEWFWSAQSCHREKRRGAAGQLH